MITQAVFTNKSARIWHNQMLENVQKGTNFGTGLNALVVLPVSTLVLTPNLVWSVQTIKYSV
jgi:hypothetical protein